MLIYLLVNKVESTFHNLLGILATIDLPAYAVSRSE
jgi:hypothetical protein